jgi:hypothetical protein
VDTLSLYTLILSAEYTDARRAHVGRNFAVNAGPFLLSKKLAIGPRSA